MHASYIALKTKQFVDSDSFYIHIDPTATPRNTQPAHRGEA